MTVIKSSRRKSCIPPTFSRRSDDPYSYTTCLKTGTNARGQDWDWMASTNGFVKRWPDEGIPDNSVKR